MEEERRWRVQRFKWASLAGDGVARGRVAFLMGARAARLGSGSVGQSGLVAVVDGRMENGGMEEREKGHLVELE